MNERPTPETDAETMRDEYEHFDSDFGPFAPSDTVSADFARRLERERDEAWKFLREATKQRDGALDELEVCVKDRDEAREALDCLLAVIGLTPIAGNKHALQEAVDHGLAVLRKQQEAAK